MIELMIIQAAMILYLLTWLQAEAAASSTKPRIEPVFEPPVVQPASLSWAMIRW